MQTGRNSVVPIQCSLKLVERVKTQKYVQTWQPVLIFQRRSPTPKCGANPGGYDRHILTRPRFLYSAPTSQVSSSYVYSFRSYRVDKQTNKHARPPTNRRRWKHPMLFAMLQRWTKISEMLHFEISSLRHAEPESALQYQLIIDQFIIYCVCVGIAEILLLPL